MTRKGLSCMQISQPSSAQPAGISSHKSGAIVTTISLSSWDNLIPCAPDPRKGQHTVYSQNANMLIDVVAM